LRIRNIWLLLLLSAAGMAGAQEELRGVWIAWGGANPPTKNAIAAMMEDIAAHNLNTVYVDVWRYGYPYFRSRTFYDLTGQWTDPRLENGRDVLADMIAEGHRAGLHVEAWFEYGFCACHDQNDDLYRARPEWFAQHRDGSVLFNGSLRWKWLSHLHPQAQQFLIDLCLEVAANYDVDGIELDRVRYPELDCGYDPATVAAYQADHGGAAPPAAPGDRSWMAWRAQKLTDFVAAFHDSIKAVHPDLLISNAPISYSYGYDNFCQDWRPWINEGHLDVVSTQLYWPTNAVYAAELDRQLSYITARERFFPGLCSIANEIIVPATEIAAMIRTTRARNLQGHVIWYYNTLADDLPYLRDEVYQQPAAVPGRPREWRLPARVINEEEAGASRSEGWTPYTTLRGFKEGCLYCKAGEERWIEYTADIAETGWYELYAFNIYQFSASQRAPYEIRHAAGSDTVYVNQALSGQARWFKLGDYFFRQGAGQRVVRLSNAGIEANAVLFADAIMLIRSRRPLGMPALVARQPEQVLPAASSILLENYPNPFNAATRIRFTLVQSAMVELRIHDMRGREVAVLARGRHDAGVHEVTWQAQAAGSGLYYGLLITESGKSIRKLLLLK